MAIEHYPGDKRIAYPKDALDSFGRLRVSYPFAVFDVQFNYNLQPRLFEQVGTNGNVTHIPSISTARLSTGGNTSGDSVIFQSKRYLRYRPSKSHQTVWTCILGAKKTNVLKTIGLYDDNDGLAFVQDGTGLGILHRTSTSGTAVDNIVPQSEWNLDPLDGNGQSGIVLDVSKNNIYIIDMQWLGAGRVRYGFDFSGHITYVHQLQFANTDTVPFMRTGNLPFRTEIKNTGDTDDLTTYDFTCVAINSEGGGKPSSLNVSTSNAEATSGSTPLRQVTLSNQPLPILSIRPRTTFNSLTNRGQVKPVSYQVASQDSAIVYSLILNGNLTGHVFADVANSIAQVDVSSTSITGGIVIESGYLGGEVGTSNMKVVILDIENIILSNNISGDSTDILSVVIRLVTNISSDCGGAFTWEEIY